MPGHSENLRIKDDGLVADAFGKAALILQAYGVDCATQAETRAYVGVLDRMGAFAWSERAELKKAGYL